MVERTKSKVRLSAFSDPIGEIEFDWMEIPIWIRFRSGRVTWAFSEGVPSLTVTEALEWLVETIVEWNLVDDNDDPLPVSVESLDALPRSLVPTRLISHMLKWNAPTESESSRPDSSA